MLNLEYLQLNFCIRIFVFSFEIVFEKVQLEIRFF